MTGSRGRSEQTAGEGARKGVRVREGVDVREGVGVREGVSVREGVGVGVWAGHRNLRCRLVLRLPLGLWNPDVGS